MVPGTTLLRHKHDTHAMDLPAKHYLPDLQVMSSRVRGCLEDAEDLPTDKTLLFNREMFAFDTSNIPKAAQLYHRLGMPKKPLSLIEPQFEQPLPPLQPAVFPPAIFEPDPPALERFDLDDAFANEYFKVTQLTLTARKLGGKDDISIVEDYIIKAAQVVGIKGASKMSPQHALLTVFHDLARWKLHDTGLGEHLGEADDVDEGIKI
jgi:intraflagellar transport protein 52